MDGLGGGSGTPTGRRSINGGGGGGPPTPSGYQNTQGGPDPQQAPIPGVGPHRVSYISLKLYLSYERAISRREIISVLSFI